MVPSYLTELDNTEESELDNIQFFQELIGILRWDTEIGIVDVLLETSLPSQYQASPREGHMVQALHIFAYFKKKPKLTLYYDPGLPRTDYGNFRTNQKDFLEHYQHTAEPMPHHQPRPRDWPVTTMAFVDAPHAANRKTGKSHTGYLIFINQVLIICYSKCQQTMETSSFSSEFLALKACTEAIVSLQFKLRMFGILMVAGNDTDVICNNESVVNNLSNVESVLNKKHNLLAYHYVFWVIAAVIITVGCIPCNENLADVFTKRLSETVQDYIFGNW